MDNCTFEGLITKLEMQAFNRFDEGQYECLEADCVDAMRNIRAENERLREALHIADFSVEGMAEIKAITDGYSTNTPKQVVDWVLDRIAKEALK